MFPIFELLLFASALASRYKYVHLYSGADPIFDEEDVFKLTIQLDDDYSPEQGKGSQKSSQKIIELLRSNPQITIDKMAAEIGISSRAIKKHLANL